MDEGIFMDNAISLIFLFIEYICASLKAYLFSQKRNIICKKRNKSHKIIINCKVFTKDWTNLAKQMRQITQQKHMLPF